MKLYYFIESQLAFEELKKRLEQEVIQKTNLETQMKTSKVENESSNYKVIFFVLLSIYQGVTLQIPAPLQIPSSSCF